jgi:hypothetical protein
VPASIIPALWYVPYQRNPFFTGREDVLNQLRRALQADNTVALAHPQGISGLGGIGKTQTALEYAYRNCAKYTAVLWIRADSITTIASSMVELARFLNLPEYSEREQEVVVQAVLRWLHRHPGWLLIYDNVDDLSIVEPFLPKAGPGHLLLTTRSQALGGLAQRLNVQKMEPEIGALLLLRRASMLAHQDKLKKANAETRNHACAISQELDGLPLAIDQAGAYIKEAPCPLSDYLTRYQSRRADILSIRGRFNQDYPASVATTWSLSFEKISQSEPVAAEFLHFCAFLAPAAIPEELLTVGAVYLGDVLGPAVVNPLKFDKICKEVLRFSLLQRESDARTLTMHRLVQAVLRDTLSANIQQQWIQRAVQSINAAVPSVNF